MLQPADGEPSDETQLIKLAHRNLPRPTDKSAPKALACKFSGTLAAFRRLMTVSFAYRQKLCKLRQAVFTAAMPTGTALRS
jgi:hypothetical protein